MAKLRAPLVMAVLLLPGVPLGAHAGDQSRIIGPALTSPSQASVRDGPGWIYSRIPERDEFGRDQLAMFRRWNPDPVGLHETNLSTLNPRLARIVRKVQTDYPGLRFVIGSGRRDAVQQRLAFAWGWSKTLNGPHRSGDAVDLWPLAVDGLVHFDPEVQKQLGIAMRRAAADLHEKLRWGGDFRSFTRRDRSHFELVSP